MPHLLKRLPPQKYHVYIDNLFTSNNLFLYFRSLGFGATGTCRSSSGVISDLAEMKKQEKAKDQMEWGALKSFPNETGQVLYTGWKDNAFALAMTIVHTADGSVRRLRRRPKETSSMAKTARKPFGD